MRSPGVGRWIVALILMRPSADQAALTKGISNSLKF